MKNCKNENNGRQTYNIVNLRNITKNACSVIANIFLLKSDSFDNFALHDRVSRIEVLYHIQ